MKLLVQLKHWVSAIFNIVKLAFCLQKLGIFFLSCKYQQETAGGTTSRCSSYLGFPSKLLSDTGDIFFLALLKDMNMKINEGVLLGQLEIFES